MGTEVVGFGKETGVLLKKNVRDYGMFIALAIIVAIFSFATDGGFVTARNMSNLINQMGYIGVLAVGMTLILIIKYIDLSVGYVVGFSGAVAAILMKSYNMGSYTTILAVLAIGVFIGLVYGYLVSKVGVPAFVTTLAGMLIFRGLLLLITEKTGTIVIKDKAFNAIGQGYIPDITKVDGLHILTLIIGVVAIIGMIISSIIKRRNLKKYNFETISLPMFILKCTFVSIAFGYIVWTLSKFNGLSWTVVILAVVVLIYSFVMNNTTLGRHIYGVGGNAEAAELSGVSVKKITCIVYASMGLLSALAGILYASRFGSATTTGGAGLELEAIAAAYVGGVSANGGIGKVSGSIIGALVMASLSNGMNLIGTGASLQYIIKGAILVTAVIFDVMTRKKAH
jgi:putative multiple sugar transport system permease protein